MKKTATLLLALAICFGSVFALASCGLQEALENADYTEEYTADNKEGSVELINSFFEETLKDPDFVVTNKTEGDKVQYTETVKGTSSHTVYSDGAEMFAYKKGEFFYIAAIDREENGEGEVEETRYYYCSDSSKGGYLADDEYSTMEDMYKGNYCSFLGKYGGVGLVDSLPEEGNTFSCIRKGERKDGVTTGSLEFVFTTESGTLKITADSKENLVKTLRIVVTDKSGLNASRDLTWTFVYGGASVTIPDTDAWDREAAEAEAAEDAKQETIEANMGIIMKRDEFLDEAVYGENLIITVSGDVFNFVETIADGIDRVVYDSYTTYTYLEEVGEFDFDCYVVFDVKAVEEYEMEAEKYYVVNPEDDSYGDNRCVYYSYIIGLFDGDEALESATYTCDIEGDAMTFKVVSDEGTFTLSAIKTGGVVKAIDISISDTEDPTTITISFEYGSAELSKPDLSEYELISPDGTDWDN